MQIKPYDILGNYYHTILDEYNSEDKGKYELLFDRYFPQIDNGLKVYDFTSRQISIYGTKISLHIKVYQENDVYKPYFIFNVENLYIEPLRELPQIRELVKLCIYISEMDIY